FVFTDTLLIFDHVRHRIKVLCLARVDGDPGAAYSAAVAKIEGLVRRLQGSLAASATKPAGRNEFIADLLQELEAERDDEQELYAEDAVIQGPVIRLAH